MGIFRHNQEVRTAQTNLDAYTAQQKRAGNHDETDEYLRLNDAADAAYRNEKSAKKAKKRG
ncbi:MAG: hypothetical protein HOY79_17945 [Streptomyces sp.]|nr:hypothetical protein [Streptomyces sp.]